MATVLLTSGSSWTVLSDCYIIDKVECIGPGAAGANGVYTGGVGGTAGGAGGGGGAYARKNNIATVPGASVAYVIGTTGTATNFKSGTCIAATASGQTGGQSASCVGDTTATGSNGVSGTAGTFGTAGPGGAGGTAAGGIAQSGSGGAGGATNAANGAAGNPYGGGGGGGAGVTGGATPGSGAGGYQGCILITYTPNFGKPSSGGFNMPMLGM